MTMSSAYRSNGVSAWFGGHPDSGKRRARGARGRRVRQSLSSGEFAPLGEEGGLADPAGGAERGDGLTRRLPGGDRVPPELVRATAATGLRHRSGLLVGEKAPILHDLTRRPATGRLPVNDEV